MSAPFHKALSLDDLDENAGKAVDIQGVSVLICKAGGVIYAVENKCSHAAQPLEGGRIRSCFLFCPAHGARFDLRDGTTKGQLTQTPIRTFAARVSNGDIEVCLELPAASAAAAE